MEQKFREVGLSFKLDGGRWYVLEDYVVCENGKKISNDQAKMLRFLDMRIDEFKIKVTSYCDKKGGYSLVDEIGFSDEFEGNSSIKKMIDDDEDNNDMILIDS